MSDGRNEIRVTTKIPQSLIEAWLELGSRALLEGYAPRRSLADCLRDCEQMVIVSTWLGRGMNITCTARDLGIGRRRVRNVIERWRSSMHDDETARIGPSGPEDMTREP